MSSSSPGPDPALEASLPPAQALPGEGRERGKGRRRGNLAQGILLGAIVID